MPATGCRQVGLERQFMATVFRRRVKLAPGQAFMPDFGDEATPQSPKIVSD
jgi:hypothetical protein